MLSYFHLYPPLCFYHHRGWTELCLENMSLLHFDSKLCFAWHLWLVFFWVESFASRCQRFSLDLFLCNYQDWTPGWLECNEEFLPQDLIFWVCCEVVAILPSEFFWREQKGCSCPLIGWVMFQLLLGKGSSQWMEIHYGKEVFWISYRH